MATKILPELIAVKAAYAYILVSFHKMTGLMLVQTNVKKPSSLQHTPAHGRRFLQWADTPAGPRIVRIWILFFKLKDGIYVQRK